MQLFLANFSHKEKVYEVISLIEAFVYLFLISVLTESEVPLVDEMVPLLMAID